MKQFVFQPFWVWKQWNFNTDFSMRLGSFSADEIEVFCFQFSLINSPPWSPEWETDTTIPQVRSCLFITTADCYCWRIRCFLFRAGGQTESQPETAGRSEDGAHRWHWRHVCAQSVKHTSPSDLCFLVSAFSFKLKEADDRLTELTNTDSGSTFSLCGRHLLLSRESY